MNWNPYRNSTLNDLRAIAIVWSVALILAFALSFAVPASPVADPPLRVTLKGRFFSSTAEWGTDGPPSYYLMLPEEEEELKGLDASYEFMFTTPTKYILAGQLWNNRQVIVHGQLLIDYWGNDFNGEPSPPCRTVLVHSIEANEP